MLMSMILFLFRFVDIKNCRKISILVAVKLEFFFNLSTYFDQTKDYQKYYNQKNRISTSNILN